MAARSMAQRTARAPGESPGAPLETYDARAVVRRGATREAVAAAALVGRVAAAALARAAFRALSEKHRSSASSTFTSTCGVFSPRTSVISETTRNLARSSIRFSRKDRLLDLLRNV